MICSRGVVSSAEFALPDIVDTHPLAGLTPRKKSSHVRIQLPVYRQGDQHDDDPRARNEIGIEQDPHHVVRRKEQGKSYGAKDDSEERCACKHRYVQKPIPQTPAQLGLLSTIGANKIPKRRCEISTPSQWESVRAIGTHKRVARMLVEVGLGGLEGVASHGDLDTDCGSQPLRNESR